MSDDNKDGTTLLFHRNADGEWVPDEELPEQPSRRGFLKVAAAGAFGLGALHLTLLPPARVADAAAREGSRKVQFGFVVDTTLCIGCTRCVDACCQENSVPEGNLRTWVERYTQYTDDKVAVDLHQITEPYHYGELPTNGATVRKSFFVPKLCNHCTNTPCVQVCPVNAAYVAPEGVVLVDPEQCIGCSYCVQACPFGTRFINPVTNTADKCTWCYHRTTRGLNPGCVDACPRGARIFGDTSDPDSEISKKLRDERIDVLKSYLGTRPRTRYVGLTVDVI